MLFRIDPAGIQLPESDRPLNAYSVRPQMLMSLRCLLVVATALGLAVALVEPCPVASSADLPVVETGGEGTDLFRRDNLVAWCIVPFDDRNRSPEERALMLRRLRLGKYAYDYRAEHIPTFDAEMAAIKRHGIELTAWWFPTELNDEARLILDVLRRHGVQTQLWVTGGGAATTSPEEQRQRVEAEAARIGRIATAAAEIGCRVSLYNHGGWFGEPENQIEIIRQLGLPNVGIVYNLHHGHDHLDRFADLLSLMQPHLDCLNLNGMVEGGDQTGQKILPLGEGDLDLELLQIISDSGYDGPIGILNHTQENAETRLRKNLEGLESLLPQLQPRQPAAAADAINDGAAVADRAEDDLAEVAELATEADLAAGDGGDRSRYSPAAVRDILAHADRDGDADRGAAVFVSAKFACLNCHRIGRHGGQVGPELTSLRPQRSPAEIVEAVYWPQRTVGPQYQTLAVLKADGQTLRGYEVSRDDDRLVLRDPATEAIHTIAWDDIEAEREVGSLMPDGLTAAMTPREQADVVAFLLTLGSRDGPSPETLDETLARARAHVHGPSTFPLDRRPLRPADWPNWESHVNRDRIYDFYAKQARYFRGQAYRPPLLAEFPGLDGDGYGHWGNQDEATWDDDRWSESDRGSLLAGVFRGGGLTVPRAVCLRVGEPFVAEIGGGKNEKLSEWAVCFDPETLSYPLGWTGGLVRTSSVRSGLIHGLMPAGEPRPLDAGRAIADSGEYRGFYRHGDRVAFVYRIDGEDHLDVPVVEAGRFDRVVAPLAEHPYGEFTAGGPSQWPEQIRTPIELGDETRPYAIDTIGLPFDNRWNSLMYLGDLAFHGDGSAYVCTLHGDVWRVTGIDHPSTEAVWKRFAAGLHQPLGMVIDDDGIFVLGRDQITRLHDLNGNGEADFYECFSSVLETSPAGHDYICGLQRDPEGYFYTASGNQGLVRISPDGQTAEVLATGLRNPDGLGLYPDGSITVPNSEGNWVPASMIGLVRPGERPHFGYPGPRDDQPPALPMVYLPRALDNSSGGQAYVPDDRWGPLRGQMIHFSYGAAAHFLVLRDDTAEIAQGAVVPLPGEFLSGAHRGCFRPQDGQLYVAGAAGWGNYAMQDGCFQRVRFTGAGVRRAAVRLPVAIAIHQNGVRITFSQPLDPTAAEAEGHFAQCWNYRYGPGYGSPEFSTSHPGTAGHDTLEIASAHLSGDRKTLFLELPELQPVNQLHLYLQTAAGENAELFVTVNRLGDPFTDFPGYRPVDKPVRPHPILADVLLATRSIPNPWRQPIEAAREVRIECTNNLTFATTVFRARPGEAIKLTLVNPDVVPHNWALLTPGSLQRVGELTNRYIADPEAPLRHYVPDAPEVLAYTDIVSPQQQFSIYFHAPDRPGRYPYLCTFPGHWSVMNGELIVEP